MARLLDVRGVEEGPGEDREERRPPDPQGEPDDPQARPSEQELLLRGQGSPDAQQARPDCTATASRSTTHASSVPSRFA
jgi:hypothetical protein